MNNFNPIYLIEDKFFRKLGSYLANDIRYTKQRWLGGNGRKYVRKAIKQTGTPRDLLAIENNAKTNLYADHGLIADTSSIDKYLDRKGNWEYTRREVGDEMRQGLANAKGKIKNIFRKKQSPPSHSPSNFNPASLYDDSALIGAGVLGAGGLAIAASQN